MPGQDLAERQVQPAKETGAIFGMEPLELFGEFGQFPFRARVRLELVFPDGVRVEPNQIPGAGRGDRLAPPTGRGFDFALGFHEPGSILFLGGRHTKIIMNLYIVRHGIAVDVGEHGVRKDSDRFLSEDGRRKTAAVGRGLKHLGVKPDLILTSPLARTRETAELIADAYDPALPFEVFDPLAPGGDFVEMVRSLKERSAAEVMLVGHMPEVAEWVSMFVVGDPGMEVTFKRAAVACIRFDGPPAVGCGRLEWLIPPGVLRHLGEE
jgi:phosphohistidine phosphatase